MRLCVYAVVFFTVVGCDRAPAPTEPSTRESEIAAPFAKAPNVSVHECDLSVERLGPPGREPLFIIDGVPLENARRDIENVDPNDIESVSIMKSVAASAIFGARGAYGAVLITTKHHPGKRSR